MILGRSEIRARSLKTTNRKQSACAERAAIEVHKPTRMLWLHPDIDALIQFNGIKKGGAIFKSEDPRT